MLLAVDIGNTNSVFALYDGQRQLGQWRLSTSVHRTADEYGLHITQLLQMSGLSSAHIRHAMIGSVVPSTVFPLRKALQQYFQATVRVLGEDALDIGIANHLERPQEAGADRLVNACAAYHRYGGNLIIIDFGTATTFDVVGDDGAFEGGIIAPGINLSMEALHRAAAKLPKVDIARPMRVVGKNTVSAMQSGLFYGYLSLIEGLIERITQELARPMQVIATGGLAPLFTAHSARIDRQDAELTLEGLRLIHERNLHAFAADTPIEPLTKRMESIE